MNSSGKKGSIVYVRQSSYNKKTVIFYKITVLYL